MLEDKYRWLDDTAQPFHVFFSDLSFHFIFSAPENTEIKVLLNYNAKVGLFFKKSRESNDLIFWNLIFTLLDCF